MVYKLESNWSWGYLFGTICNEIHKWCTNWNRIGLGIICSVLFVMKFTNGVQIGIELGWCIYICALSHLNSNLKFDRLWRIYYIQCYKENANSLRGIKITKNLSGAGSIFLRVWKWCTSICQSFFVPLSIRQSRSAAGYAQDPLHLYILSLTKSVNPSVIRYLIY